jgi:TPR repeat protein
MKQFYLFAVIAGFALALGACKMIPSIPTISSTNMNEGPVETVLEGCRGGDLTQCRLAGNRYRSGINAPKDLNLAAECYAKLCAGGEDDGCKALYGIGYDYLTGDKTDKNPEKAMNLFDAACTGKYGPACTSLGRGYMKGAGVKKDRKKAMALFESGCENGSGRGCVQVGNHYIKKNPKKAKTFYEKACGWDSSEACAALGLYYLKGKGGEQNDQLAYEYLLKSCDNAPSDNDSRGCLALGDLYAKGRGVAQDKTEAVKYYRMACYVSRPKQSEACIKLARACQTGEGVEKDANCAHEYFRQACDLGNKKGCREMHKVRCKGLGIPDSCKWLKKHDIK